MEKCLLPIISNAVIHGIEPSAERRFAGKNEVGSVCLAAYQDHQHLLSKFPMTAGALIRERSNPPPLPQKLFTGEELYKMSDDELIDIIMSPGFTAGTGAAPLDNQDGMHSVRTVIDKLNGFMRIKSTVGKGTSVRLRIPLRIPLFRH
jgi:two-component system, chemotaxis family, sensor kinase CheA